MAERQARIGAEGDLGALGAELRSSGGAELRFQTFEDGAPSLVGEDRTLEHVSVESNQKGQTHALATAPESYLTAAISARVSQ